MAISNKVSESQRHQMIAEAAYFRAEKRGFAGDPVADWIEAEVEVDARVREIENAHLIEHLEEGLAVATKRLSSLKRKVSNAASEARTEWRTDVEKLGKLRDALRVRGRGRHQSKAGIGHACFLQELPGALDVALGQRRALAVVAVARRHPLVAGRRLAFHRDLDDRFAVERELEEIGTQLDWVRDYL